MRGEAPAFWWREKSPQAFALAPFAALYGAAAARRMMRGARQSAALPVLCVGNFTVGGGGKTPTALRLAIAARALGRQPGFLSRGYGGSVERTVLVDPERHGALEAGDEPLLLAASAPTAVSRDRAAGCRLLLEAGCDIAIMDDGFQSAGLETDLALLVVDGRRGLGNGRVLPAGPLRAPLHRQLAHTDIVLVVGPGEAGNRAEALIAGKGIPVERARLVPRAVDHPGRQLLAFAGIADPGKFFRTLLELGLPVGETRRFGDHHVLSDAEASAILSDADARGLTPATTRKDAVRLDIRRPAHRALAERALVVDIDLVPDDPTFGERIVEQAIEAYERRAAKG